MIFKEFPATVIDSLNDAATYDVRDADEITIQFFSGAFNGTLTFTGSADGTNYSSLALEDCSSTSAARVASATANGMWRIRTAGLKYVRVTCTTFTSATNAVLNANSARS